MPEFFILAASLLLYLISNLSFQGELFFRISRAGAVARGAMAAGAGMQLLWFLLAAATLQRFPVHTLGQSLLFFALLIAVVYLYVEFWLKIKGLGFFASALSVLMTLSSLPFATKLSSRVASSPVLSSPWFLIHVSVIFLSYGVFALAFCSSLAYLIQERLLKGKKPGGIARRLPPLDLLDLLINRLVTIGFPLLTLGIITGALWAQMAWGSWWRWDPKETWALITWLIYAIYLHARSISGWKGHKLVLLIVIGFLVLLFTFLGVTYLIPGKHTFVGVL